MEKGSNPFREANPLSAQPLSAHPRKLVRKRVRERRRLHLHRTRHRTGGRRRTRRDRIGARAAGAVDSMVRHALGQSLPPRRLSRSRRPAAVLAPYGCRAASDLAVHPFVVPRLSLIAQRPASPTPRLQASDRHVHPRGSSPAAWAHQKRTATAPDRVCSDLHLNAPRRPGITWRFPRQRAGEARTT